MQNSAVFERRGCDAVHHNYSLLFILFSFKQKRTLPCGKAHLI